MKRPLACVGLCYLTVQLCAVFLPSVAVLPLAAACVAAGVFGWKYGQKMRVQFAVFCGAAAAALLLQAAARVFWVAPIQAREGTEADIHAVVVEASHGFVEESCRATVLVDAVDGKPVRPFRVYFALLPESEPGDRFAAQVRFDALEQNAYRGGQYADGVFLAAAYVSDYRFAGPSDALWARACRLRTRVVGALRRTLSQPYAGMAAAMTVGDRTALEPAVQETLRRAGLSHVIALSGLHLSAFSGLLYVVLRKLFGRRFGAAAAMLSTWVFLIFVGFPPSAVRAGITMTLFYGGILLLRQSDGFTSLGLAALLMGVKNPYAVLDVGLLLSFSATAGVLWGAEARRRWENEHARPQHALLRIGASTFWLAAASAAAAFLTIPALMFIDGGVSLLCVASNLLVIPLLPLVVGSGFLTGLCGMIPGLEAIARLAGLVCSLALRWVLGVARRIADVPYAFLHVSGAFAFCCVLLLCALGYSAWKLRVPLRRAAVCCLLFAAFCGALYAAADRGVVRILLAGSGANPSIVVLEGMKTAVLYRGPDGNVRAVADILEQYNRTNVDFLVDLRTEANADELAAAFAARETVCVESEILNHAVYAPFGDVRIYVRRQANGNLACIEVEGYRVGVASGGVELSALPPLDVYIAGTGTPTGLSCRELILPRPNSYRWLETIPTGTRVWQRAQICLRAGASATIREE